MSADRRSRAGLLLAVALAAGAAALVFEFAFLPAHYAATMEVREVVEDAVLEVGPRIGRVGARLYPGARFHLTGRERDGWVHVWVHPGLAGWIERAALARSTRPVAPKPRR